jgi:adenylyltransferase/sulfurtransferase
MAITIQIPTALRNFTDRQAEVTVEAATAGEAIAALAQAYPDIGQHLYQEDGRELRSFINVFIGEINIKRLKGLDTPVPEGGTIMLVPAIAGGQERTRTGERVLANSCNTPCPPINAAVQKKVTGGGAQDGARTGGRAR